MALAFPYHAELHGDEWMSDVAHGDALLRQRLLQLLFTNPGERVNRPQFGIGVARFVFESGRRELAALLEMRVRAGILESLQDAVDVDDVAVAFVEEALELTIRWRSRASQRSYVERMTHRAGVAP